MRVLVACERSGRVRDALLRRGVDAVSCDVEPSDAPGPHIRGRVEEHLTDGWDMLVAFPPCTFLTRLALACWLGSCAYPGHDEPHYTAWRRGETINAALLFRALLDCGIPKVAVENPLPHRFAARLLGPPSGSVEPYYFGDAWTKRTYWWLRGLPMLYPTRVVTPTIRWINANPRSRMTLPQLPSRGNDPESATLRSITPLGMAEAIAEQWGSPAAQALF